MSTLKTNNIQHVDLADPSILLNSDGSVSIAGTVSYEDVTNVDSVGIITARKQLHVGTGVSIAAGGLNVTAGVSTFTAIQVSATAAFSGDVDLGNASSDAITFTGRVDSDLNPSGSTRDLGTSGVEWRSAYLLNGVVASDTIATHAGDTNTKIRFPAADTVSVETAGGEAIRVDSGGRLLIGTATTKSAGSGQYAKLNVEGYAGGTECFVSLSRAEAASAMSANDEVANLTFNDSAGYEFARIQVLADAATGATDTPGRIVFKTTADGASSATERLRINSSGAIQIKGGTNGHLQIDNNGEFEIFESDTSLAATNSAKIAMDFDSNVARLRVSGNGSFSQRPLGIFLGAQEKLRLDTSARLLIGHTSSLTVNGTQHKVQIIGTDYATSGLSQQRFQAGVSGASILLGHSRNDTIGTQTALQSGDELGKIRFIGSDGTDMSGEGAEIVVTADGNFSSNSLPTKMAFKTTPNGSNGPTTRMTIDQNGYVKINSTDGSGYHTIRLNTTTNNAMRDVVQILSSVDSATAADGFGCRMLFAGENLNGNNYTYGAIAGKLSTTGSNYGHLSFFTNNNGTIAEKVRITEGTAVEVYGNSASVQTIESGGATVKMQSGGSQGYFGTGTNHHLSIRTNNTIVSEFTEDGDLHICHPTDNASGQLLGVIQFSSLNSNCFTNQEDMYRINFWENTRNSTQTRTDNSNASIRYNASTSDGGDGSIRFANESATRLLYMNRLGNGGTSGSWSVGSDARKKENITTVTDALTKVSQLRGVDFNWKTKWGGHADSGVIAQEVESVLPNLVLNQDGAKDTDEDGNTVIMKHVNYNGLWGVMIEAVKVLITKNEALEARIATLEKSI